MSTFDLIAISIWWFIPAGIANMMPVFAAKIPGLKHLDYPVDFGTSFRGQRVLGDHKTWRGIILGTLAAMAVAAWQLQTFYGLIPDDGTSSWQIRYGNVNPLLLGFLLGSGALIGDMVKSFFKRQKQVPSGHSWFPWDQIDYILGGLLFSAFVLPFTPLSIYFCTFFLYFILHLVVSYVGYLTGFKADPI